MQRATARQKHRPVSAKQLAAREPSSSVASAPAESVDTPANNESTSDANDFDHFLSSGGFAAALAAVSAGGATSSSSSSLPSSSTNETDADANELDTLTPTADDRRDDQAERAAAAHTLSSASGDGDNDDDDVDGNDDDAAEIARHKRQLQQLRERDPQFFEFLQRAEPDLLAFEDVPEEKDVETLKHAREELARARAASVSASLADDTEDAGVPVLNDKLLHTLIERSPRSVPHCRRLVLAFRAGCHLADADNVTAHASGGGDAESAPPALTQAYRILNSRIYNTLMVHCLSQLDGALYKHLGVSGSNVGDVTRAPHWRRVEPLVKSAVASVLHLLRTLVDNSTRAYALRQLLRGWLPLLVPYERQVRRLLLLLLDLWSAPTAGGSDAAPSVLAFLCIRALSLLLPATFHDQVLRRAHLTYVRSAAFMSAQNAPRIKFLQNGVVELLGLDPAGAYQHGFVCIRELAVHLRAALQTTKDAEAYRRVYNWQYLASLQLWTRVLCEYASNSELEPLRYPLAQLLFGAATLRPSAHYLPYRFHCADLLLDLSDSTGCFLSVAPMLLDVLHNCAEFHRRPTAATGPSSRSIDARFALSFAQSYTHTKAFQDTVFARVCELIARQLLIVARTQSIAFSEFALPVVLRLRAWEHTEAARALPHFSKQLKAFAERIEQERTRLTQWRSTSVRVGPRDYTPPPAASSPQPAAVTAACNSLSSLQSQWHARAFPASAATTTPTDTSSSSAASAAQDDNDSDGAIVDNNNNDDDNNNDDGGGMFRVTQDERSNGKRANKQQKQQQRQQQQQQQTARQNKKRAQTDTATKRKKQASASAAEARVQSMDVVEDLQLSSDDDE